MFVDKVVHNKENKTKPIVICDYGTADGGIFMVLMKKLIGLKHSFLPTHPLYFMEICTAKLYASRVKRFSQ